MSTRPPRFPLWLLATFGCGPNVDALIGDLTEEYRTGRSATWLWWQGIVGVASTFGAEVRAYPWLMIRLVIVWSVVLTLTSQALVTAAQQIRQYLSERGEVLSRRGELYEQLRGPNEIDIGDPPASPGDRAREFFAADDRDVSAGNAAGR